MHDTHASPTITDPPRPHRRRRSTVLCALLAVAALVVGGLLVSRPWHGDDPTAVSLLPTAARPQSTVLATDAHSVELGLRFSAAVEGTVVGLRLYRGQDDIAPRAARLWAPDGTVLGELSFAAPAGIGWQTMMFDSAVRVDNAGTYTASYHASGGYVAEAEYFPLGAVPDGDALLRPDPITAGVFAYGSTPILPTQSVAGTNYWIDVLFLPAAPVGSGETAAPSEDPAPQADGLNELSVPQPGEVGFIGDPSSLRVIDGPSSAPDGTTWNNDTLRVDAANVTLEEVWVKGSVDYHGAGTLTIRNSIIEANGSFWAVVFGRDAAGTLNISDSTVTWPGDVPAPGPTWGTGAISGDSRMLLVRNDISGAVDGVQQSGGSSLIQQNYIHDLRLFGTYPRNSHNDGLQFYGGPNVVVLSNRIELNGYDGTHQNSAVFFSDDGTGFESPQIIGNYLSGGGITLRLEGGTTGAVVTDNRFGPIAGGFDYVSLAAGATLARWSGNRAVDGAPISAPQAG